MRSVVEPNHECLQKDLAGNPLAAHAYLPLRALAAYSGLSVRTLRGYLSHSSHPLPHYRVGGNLLVQRSEFDDWMRGSAPLNRRGSTASWPTC